MPMQSQHFFLLELEGEGIFQTVTMHLQLYMYTLIFYIFAVQSLHKRCMVPSLRRWSHTQVYFLVNGSVPAKFGCRWSRSAGSRPPQILFCTESSVHGISVIISRQSWTTEIVKSSFNCTYTVARFILQLSLESFSIFLYFKLRAKYIIHSINRVQSSSIHVVEEFKKGLLYHPSLLESLTPSVSFSPLDGVVLLLVYSGSSGSLQNNQRF